MSDLLALALQRHGGLERWRRLDRVVVSMTATGALFDFKGHPDQPGTVQATADLTTAHLTYRPFLGWAEGEFRADQVVVRTDDGSTQVREHPREAFTHRAPQDPWDDLHLLYFTGYAMT